MIVLQVQEVTKYFGADLILSNIKLEVQSRDRIALVGRNGAGKSTLLKIISGQLSHDSGSIMKPKEIEIGYLAQNSGLESELTIWEEMLKVYNDLQQMEDQIRQLEKKMGQESVLNDPVLYEKVLAEYDELQQTFQQRGGYQYENDIRSVLHGFRFYEEDYEKPVSSLSGGQKTRLALVKLLLTRPDLLILDEPTNHLDIETLNWLEGYLQSYPGALLIVSHDRYFLDKVSTQVYEISRQKSKKYLGNYSHYLKQKAEQYEQELKEFEKQQAEINKLQDFVQRNIARASTTKRAQSRRRQLERMEVLDRPDSAEKSAQFGFKIERQTGNDVLKLDDLSIGYDEPLAEHINLHIQREESIALVGPNGIGKSTLIKTIIDSKRKFAGSIQFGSNIQIGYYDQEQANLNSHKTVLQELWDEYPTHTEKEIRTVLGNFLFSGDDVLKGVNELSGGQKARLALAKLMLQKANVLILDEPTNHLDLDSKEVLENALIDYPGTILFISHDRYFINRIATRVVDLTQEGLENYLGDYDYFLEKKAEIAELERLEREENSVTIDAEKVSDTKEQFQVDKQAKKDERKRLRRIDELETRIEQHEQQIELYEQDLADPEVFQDYEKTQEINGQLQTAQQGLESLLEEWERLQIL
ncbi:ABC-F family ATP-binding cassette domain-containing protein [Alkalihalobacillus sp. AL-G]|uniref:ABC-F family ATP-binding cassette domain-containing protein n=1 Tax=Alkalihalobacillus sp. AL-G TaxID=2926399 RepID=UPI00272A8894|nr:ABC-F family ATP-binding cassette domain-containing protein [Alkalihalobacillus sp. AL-G]WLD93690.1 ABC-F family ATP-binding cassette domain-containing protein [Alkalihalobacillus sp. AL-G]